MKRFIDIFVELGRRVEMGLPQEVCRRAIEQNEWFSQVDIDRALGAIAEQMLSRDRLEEWLAGYDLTGVGGDSVLIVMAGNIPLVGFFDLLTVLASGHRAVVKLSHKDRVLMEWVMGELLSIESDIPIYIYNEGMVVDRVIATGGESAANYFESRYSSVKRLIRGSRHSVAVISDSTSSEQLVGLCDDIYSYSGLGCRNVSMLFVPRGFELERLVSPAQCSGGYRNNYLQTRALLTISGESFYDNGVSCLRYCDSFPAQLSEISIFEYDDIEQVERWLDIHDEELQCVVADGSTVNHPRRCDFAQAQYPTLFDYADGVDTMLFLR